MTHADDALEIYGAPQLERSFGVSVTFSRGGPESGPFVATWEMVDYEVIDDQDFFTKVTSRDFVFPVSAPVLDGSIVEPRAGDRISLTENGVAVVFQIVPMGKRPAAELMPGGFRWKVHTKKVG